MAAPPLAVTVVSNRPLKEGAAGRSHANKLADGEIEPGVLIGVSDR